jgi:hypothetical protein
MTTWWFALDSLVLNGALAYYGRAFYGDANSQSARRLFLLSVIHLPLLLILFMLHKKPRAAPCPGTPAAALAPTPTAGLEPSSAAVIAPAIASAPVAEAATQASVLVVASEVSDDATVAAPAAATVAAPAAAGTDGAAAA